jgi:hypothetical protein
MEADRRVASLETARESLRRLVAEMMRRDDVVPMLNTLFGIRLPEEAVCTARTAGDLARMVEGAWFQSGGTAEELAERVAVLDDE